MTDGTSLLDRICAGLRDFGLDASREVLLVMPNAVRFLEGSRIRILLPNASRQNEAMGLIEQFLIEGRSWVNCQFYGRIGVGELVLVEWSPQVGADRSSLNFSGPYPPVSLQGGDATSFVEYELEETECHP